MIEGPDDSAARDAGTVDLTGALAATGGVRVTVEVLVWDRAGGHPVPIEWDVSAELARRFGTEPLTPWPWPAITSVRLLADARPIMVMPLYAHGAGLHTICTAGGDIEEIPTF